jgi:hypothetical protein
MTGFLYVIQRQPDGPIKIGHAQNPARRLQFLQTGSVEPLVLLTSAPGSRDDERALHRRFASCRIRNEWFHPTDDLLALVQDIIRTGALPALEAIPAPARPVNSDTRVLLSEIESFLSFRGISETSFGQRACSDGKLILDLRRGRRLWPETAERVRHFIREYVPGMPPRILGHNEARA